MQDTTQAEPIEAQTEGLSIHNNMLWHSFGSVVNLICQYLVTVLLVRLSGGYEAAGVYSLATSVYGIFSTLSVYRLDTIQITDVTGENTIGEYVAMRIITCTISLMLTMGYACITCSPDVWMAILLYTLYKVAVAMVSVLHACDRLHRRMDYSGKSQAVQGILSLATFLVAFLLTAHLELSMLFLILSVLFIGVAYDLPRTSRFGTIRVSIRPKKALHLLVSCLPLVLAGVALSAAAYIPRQYLSYVDGDAILGIYTSIAAPTTIIQMGASYIYGPLLTYFSEACVARDKKRFLSLLARCTAGIALVGMACILGVLLLGESVLVLLYGESIRDYVYLLRPAVIFTLLTGFSWFVNDLSISARNFRSAFAGSCANLSVALLLVVPTVSTYSMMGVNYVGMISCIVASVVMIVMLLQHMRKSFSAEA